MISYLDDPPKIKRYVKTFKEKNNNLMHLRIDDAKLLQMHKAIWTEAEELKKFEMNALPVCDNRYIESKIRTYGDKFYDNSYIKSKIRTCGDNVYTDFRGLNIPEDGVECESFTVISIDSLLVYENKYMRIYINI